MQKVNKKFGYDENGYYMRTLDKWTVIFAGHLQSLLGQNLEEIELKKPEAQDGNLDSVVTSEDYQNALKMVEDYFANFNDEILAQHQIEKSEEDFKKLIKLNLKKLQFYSDDYINIQTW